VIHSILPKGDHIPHPPTHRQLTPPFPPCSQVDLDTIETSNLNRQFLFRNHHVGKSKAEVACEAVRSLRPNANITAYHGNVKDPHFTPEFIKSFDIVLNGLDNLDARFHVNRLCLAAEVPLIESGTAGYLGQTSVHLGPEMSECFECQPKPKQQKTYPVCTVRSTPEKPIHCIVWSKELLFPRLFGDPKAQTDLDDGDSNDNKGGQKNGDNEDEKKQLELAKKLDDASFFLRKEDEPAKEYAHRIFKKVFSYNIKKLAELDTAVWKLRKRPTPLDLNALLEEFKAEQQGGDGKQQAKRVKSESASKCLALTDDHTTWTPAQSAAVFIHSIVKMLEERADEVGTLSFDKDDDLAVDFLTATTNLRCYNYSIPPLSLFNAKGMAGNIIHAIATTNAIISGLIVIEAIKVLSGASSQCKTTYLYQVASNKRMLMPTSLQEANPSCSACKRDYVLEIDTKRTTFDELVNKVIKAKMPIGDEFEVCWHSKEEKKDENGKSFFPTAIYEESPNLDEDEVADSKKFLPRLLSDNICGGIVSGTRLHVSESQGYKREVTIHVKHREDWEEGSDQFVLTGSFPPPPPPTTTITTTNGDDAENGVDMKETNGKVAADDDLRNDHDILLVVGEEAVKQGAGGVKRRAEEPPSSGSKKAKPTEEDNNIEVDIDLT